MQTVIIINNTYIFIIVNNDTKNPTFLVATRKAVKLKFFEAPDYYVLSLFEMSLECEDRLIQQVLFSKTTYSLTYLLPFNIGV